MDCGGFSCPIWPIRGREGVREGQGTRKGRESAWLIGVSPRPTPTHALPHATPTPPPKAGVLGGNYPRGGGGSSLAGAGNPSGSLPLHFFCNKRSYCAVLGKLIGAGSLTDRLDRGKLSPSLEPIPHTPLSPPARGKGFKGHEAGEPLG